MKAPALVMVATAVVFAGITAGVTWRLRQDLRAQILQREAESLRAMIDLQQDRAEEEFASFGLGANLNDWFPLLLETSRVRDVLALRLFDPTGLIRDALPATDDAFLGPPDDWARLQRDENIARLHERASLVGGDFDLPAPRGRPAAPLLEVLVPLREPVRHEFGGVAQYWIDGAGIVRKFTALDRSLALRSGVAIGAGLAVMLTALAWTFRRLDAANRELRARSEDLARANQEFSFAAKTSAIGAITAHLIHGLRSPLAGLEGYVTGRNGSSSDRRGEEWQTAMETTRRLRGLINEVVDILHEEKAGGAPYAVKTSELFAQAGRKIHALATACGVTLICSVGSDTELPSRRAHLLLLVLDNLLRNACEASPHGGRVTLRAVAASDRVDFLVEDQGPGLNPDVAGHLFQPILSAKPGGGGVGLVISRHLAQHAGGELTLVTSDSRGCCFRLSASVMAARMAGSLSDLP